jgi:hypothetical protein
MDKLKTAVPVLHSYAHIQSCQVQRNPKYCEGFGSSDGEASERLWAYLNAFVKMTRKMGQYNRHLVLYRAISCRNKEKKASIGKKTTNNVLIILYNQLPN